MRRGRWPSPRRSARKPAPTWKRSGETMGSSCGFRTWTSRPIQPSCCPIQTRCKRSSSGSLARRRSSRRNSARTRPDRCCCPSAGPVSGRRCGNSASVRPTSSRSRRGTARFRCCSKRIASACATSSTCPRSCRRSPTCAAARFASRPSIRKPHRRSLRRCSSATSRASSTTATRRWPNAARRRWPSINRSCASCWATPSCANCSTPNRWTPSSASSSGSIRAITSRARTASTTCCSRWET